MKRKFFDRRISRRDFFKLGGGVGAAAIIAQSNWLKPLLSAKAAGNPSNIKFPFQDPGLTAEDRVSDLISRMTLDEKVSLLEQFNGANIRLGVPQFRTGTEGLHGVCWLGPATVFPQGTGLSTTWDKNLMLEVGNVVGSEARAYNSWDARFNGIDLWAPVVDLERDPRAGRTSENMGEDPYLTGMMSTNFAFGIKGSDPFYYQGIPTLKHFMAYNMEANRTGYSANASPRNLYEYYLKGFQYAIQAGAASSAMTSYNLVNGKPTMVLPEMTSEMYDKWVPGGYEDGAFFNVTDASSPQNLYGTNSYYPSSQIGIAAAFTDSIKNGVTVMTPSDTDTPDVRRPVYEAVARGMLTEDDLTRAVHGLLLVRCHAGDLDVDPINPYKAMNKVNALNTPNNIAVAAQAAHEQVVLLKNDGNILPLSKSLSNVALVGPLTDANSTDFYAGSYPYVTYIKDKVQAALTNGAGALSWSRGLNIIALQVTNGTGTPAGKYIVAGSSAAASLTGSGTDPSDPLAQFYLYDYGYDNLLFRSVPYVDSGYLASRGSGNTIVANANPPGFNTYNRASQQWQTDQNFGFVKQTGNVASLFTMKGGTNIISNPATQTQNIYVSQTSPYNVLTNGNGSSANSQFTIITLTNGITDAVAKATGADVAIVCVGDQPSLTSRETQDRLNTGDNIKLAAYQESLVDAVATANPNTVVVIVGSYSFDIRDIKANPNIKGIIYTSHAGQELGTAVADVLFGDYAPAGRLNQTWYPGLSVLPTITDFDIIKGQRTYRYFSGAVIYPFGYGMTYTNFEYSDIAVSPTTAVNTDNPDITVTLNVKNTGSVASDEVVQLYTKFVSQLYSSDTNDPNNIEVVSPTVLRPLKTLNGFERIHLDVGEEKAVTFTVELLDLALWDVSRNLYYVEPGTYAFLVGRSSADSDVQVSANIKVSGDPIPPRDLSSITPAYNFDDYSFALVTSTGLSADVVPASTMEDNSYCIQVKNLTGAWVVYKNVNVNPAPQGIVIRASNPNTTAVAVQVWMNGASAIAGGVQLGTVTIPVTGNVYTYVNVGATLTGFTGTTADIYLVFPTITSNVGVKWLMLGAVNQASSSDVQVTSNHYNSNTSTSLSRLHIKVPAVISQKSGSLLMEALINGSGIVTSAVTWTVTDDSGNPTTLATIYNISDAKCGLLTATGTANGNVRAVATYTTSTGTISAYLEVVLNNQTVTANTNPEAVAIRSGYDIRPTDISWGPNQFTNFGAIYQYQGTLVVSAVTYPQVNPARPVTFTLIDSGGNPSTLATIVGTPAAGSVQGLSGSNNYAFNATIQATGTGDGDVYVHAVTSNGLSYVSRIIIMDQGTKDVFAGRIEAELFDASGNIAVGTAANLRADNVHGNDVGLQLNRIRNGDWAAYKNLDFGQNSFVSMTLKYLKFSSYPATIQVMIDDPVTGTEVGRLDVAGDNVIDYVNGSYPNIVYNWEQATFNLSSDLLPGVHNLYLVFTISASIPNTDISSTYGTVPGWLDLGINWFTFQNGKIFLPEVNN